MVEEVGALREDGRIVEVDGAFLGGFLDPKTAGDA
jgi:hypothetical protein